MRFGGGYFVGGASGEQFALPEGDRIADRSARMALRPRLQACSNQLNRISGADPLNLSGINARARSADRLNSRSPCSAA